MDNGGLPIISYVVGYSLNSSVWFYSNTTTLTWVPSGLAVNTSYYFKAAATNALGTGPFSNITIVSTAEMICGDGVCDGPSETCSSCIFDCGVCPLQKFCPGSPTCGGALKGKCDNGLCQCSRGFNGPDCSLSESVPIVIILNETSPAITIDTGKYNVTFGVAFKNIQEITPSGDILVSYDLNIQNFTLNGSAIVMPDGSIAQSYFYNSTLPNSANVSINIMTFLNATAVPFGNQSIPVGANGLKYSMSVIGWDFANIKNRLRIHIISDSRLEEDDCQKTDLGTDEENLRWLLINLNGVSLYGKFQDYALLDTASKLIQFSWDQLEEMVAITVPHFWHQVEFDPDFQVLVSDGDKTPQVGVSFEQGNCGVSISTSSSLVAGSIIGITIGAIVGISCIACMIMLVVSRKKKLATKRRLTGAAARSAAATATTPLASPSSSTRLLYSPSSSSNIQYDQSTPSTYRKPKKGGFRPFMESPFYQKKDSENPLYKDKDDNNLL